VAVKVIDNGFGIAALSAGKNCDVLHGIKIKRGAAEVAAYYQQMGIVWPQITQINTVKITTYWQAQIFE
jgi:hypothetical protein